MSRGRFLLLLAVCLLMGISALPAAAQGDHIRDMDLVYEVQADGTVNVTWELDWDFQETGKRGPILSLLYQQPWELDETKDVVFDIDDIHVTSPTGAITDFTTQRTSEGRYRVIELRIATRLPSSTIMSGPHSTRRRPVPRGRVRTRNGCRTCGGRSRTDCGGARARCSSLRTRSPRNSRSRPCCSSV